MAQRRRRRRHSASRSQGSNQVGPECPRSDHTTTMIGPPWLGPYTGGPATPLRASMLSQARALPTTPRPDSSCSCIPHDHGSGARRRRPSPSSAGIEGCPGWSGWTLALATSDWPARRPYPVTFPDVVQQRTGRERERQPHHRRVVGAGTNGTKVRPAGRGEGSGLASGRQAIREYGSVRSRQSNGSLKRPHG